jgi:hypothetical protein
VAALRAGELVGVAPGGAREAFYAEVSLFLFLFRDDSFCKKKTFILGNWLIHQVLYGPWCPRKV